MNRYLDRLAPTRLGESLTIILSVLVAAIAGRFWRFWSMRFWLMAAILYWGIPQSYQTLDMNGPVSDDDYFPPIILVHAFYELARISDGLTFVLMACGLLSFHPATRWIDAARHPNTISQC